MRTECNTKYIRPEATRPAKINSNIRTRIKLKKINEYKMTIESAGSTAIYPLYYHECTGPFLIRVFGLGQF